MATTSPTLSGTLRQVADSIPSDAGRVALVDADYLRDVADALDRGDAHPEDIEDAIAIAREHQRP